MKSNSTDIVDEEAAYLKGGKEPATSSILTSNSRYLNNPRFRDVYAQMGLKRDGHDIPGAYLIPEVNRAIAEETDFDRLFELIEEAKADKPEFAAWLDARFISDWTAEKVAHCAPDTVGARIHDFIVESGMEIDFMFRGEPKSDFEYLNKRRVQNHDIEHMITGLDTTPIGEIALITANTIAIYNYFDTELAAALTMQTMFLASTGLMKTALHYPVALPSYIDGMARANAMGQKQEKPLFMIKWEDYIDHKVEDAREELGFTDGPVDGAWDWLHEAASG